jgi:hypothetical protein
VFSSLNDCLATVKENERLAVFGTGEVFTLLYTYSNLHRMNILCGLDDNTDRQANLSWPFPVVSPDRAKEFDLSTVLLCANTMYNHRLLERLSRLDMPGVTVRYMSDKLQEGWLLAAQPSAPGGPARTVEAEAGRHD